MPISNLQIRLSIYSCVIARRGLTEKCQKLLLVAQVPSVRYYERLGNTAPDKVYFVLREPVLDQRTKLKAEVLVFRRKRNGQMAETSELKSSLKNPVKNYHFR